VPAEARDALRHSAGGASRDSGDLPVSGAVDDASGDWDREVGAFEVVAHRERLLGEPATAGPADEPWDDPAVTPSQVRRAEPPVLERRRPDPVLPTFRTRTVRRREPIVWDALDLGAGPFHEREIWQTVCRAPEIEFTRYLARASAWWPSNSARPRTERTNILRTTMKRAGRPRGRPAPWEPNSVCLASYGQVVVTRAAPGAPWNPCVP
jgi:hypothetical protein